jgi:hypothetical protein
MSTDGRWYTPEETPKTFDCALILPRIRTLPN